MAGSWFISAKGPRASPPPAAPRWPAPVDGTALPWSPHTAASSAPFSSCCRRAEERGGLMNTHLMLHTWPRHRWARYQTRLCPQRACWGQLVPDSPPPWLHVHVKLWRFLFFCYMYLLGNHHVNVSVILHKLVPLKGLHSFVYSWYSFQFDLLVI